LDKPYWEDLGMGDIATTNADSNIMVRYKKVPCDVNGTFSVEPPKKWANVYCNWDGVNGRSVNTCNEMTWGTYDTCADAQGDMVSCADAKPGETCFDSKCTAPTW
jgi:hypothetical protein